jgi:hypothetical protein
MASWRMYSGEHTTENVQRTKGRSTKGERAIETTSKSTQKRRIPSEESYSRQPLLFGLGRPAHDEDRAIEDTKGALDLDREVDVACTGTGLTPCHICTGTGLTPCHICTGTGLCDGIGTRGVPE